MVIGAKKKEDKRTTIKTAEKNMSCPLGAVTIDGYIGIQSWLVGEYVVVNSGIQCYCMACCM